MTQLVEIKEKINQLDEKGISEVMDLVDLLLKKKKSELNTNSLTKFWKSLAGSIRTEDAAQMEKAIDDSCERIDYNGW